MHRLIRAARVLPVTMVALDEIAEAEENWWYDDPEAVPTPRSIASHLALVSEADPAHPIILCADGRLMDGMHRVVKAIASGQTQIPAVRFDVTPAPDFVNARLADLPYPDEYL